MAASNSNGDSSSKLSNTLYCFHCRSETTTFRNGWLLSSGSLAQLCDQCGSAYENGTFCDTFHVRSDGWSDCAICKKKLHCGCIVSDKDIFITDFGGVCCMDCAKKYLMREEIMHTSVDDCPPPWNNSNAQCKDRLPNGELSIGSEEILTGNAHGSFSSSSSAMPPANESLETSVQLVTPGLKCKEQTPVLGGSSSANSSSEIGTPSESCADGARSSGNFSASRLIPLLHLRKMKEEQYLKVLGYSNSTITRLFNKVLTYSDAGIRNGRIVLPKRHAETFLPELKDRHGIRLEVHDTTGKLWKFTYRYWVNCRGRMYVLEGLKDYIATWKWQPGEEVTFYRIEPEGKLLIATEKLAPPPASQPQGLAPKKRHG